MSNKSPVVLCILDGWGQREAPEGNAPVLAHTPTFDGLMRDWPHATLITHGPDVGLPRGQMGNSEVGHTNIGAGRVVAMDLGQIDLAVEEGTFEVEPALLALIANVKAAGGVAHLLGVVSDGGVHGHVLHMLAAARAIVAHGVKVIVHAVTDGRDVAPRSAHKYVQQLLYGLPDGARIGTVSGRYFALDRDNRWERVERAYEAIVHGRGLAATGAVEALDLAYDTGESDEFIEPCVVDGFEGIADGDGVFCLNFRADRAREILAAIGDPAFDGFDTGRRPALSGFLGMVDYSVRHTGYMTAVFPKQKIANTLGAWVASYGKRQFRLAETEKYPHVTFFLNGGQETPEEGEARFMPSSPKVATYDLQPEMSEAEVTQSFLGAIAEGYDLIVVNYANPDMVGHTGNIDAAVRACEAVDAGLGQVVPAILAAGGALILTADHGNCEMMIDPETGGAHTAHTLNPVSVIVAGGPVGAHVRDGRLADLAPTVLDLMGLPQPHEMTGRSLLQA
ncbi:MAG: 2,3-bisphosphoglycerate-independent phosphoglycerate mutase [Paracoccaceae bacterium]|jgi:2,3-bisphosphoglycerate-independent phosphoglycerate mutase